jgi:glycosyltransferase involved in cell wall biosynthesis
MIYKKNDNDYSLVSILMPAFNSSEYITYSIESILKQSYTNWELIIINDASTDNTLSIINYFASKDSRIRIFTNNINYGLGFTINRALSLARGKFIARLDSDDIANASWLEKRINFLNYNLSYIAVCGSRVLINKYGVIKSFLNESISDNVINYKIYFGNPIVHPGIVFRKSNELKYNDYQYLEDWDLWVRMLNLGNIFIQKNYLIKYRLHSNNTSSRLGDNIGNLLPIIREIRNNSLFSKNKFILSDNVAWCLYRNRKYIKFTKYEILRALVFLHIHYKDFLSNFRKLSIRERNELNLALWDNTIHVSASSRSKLKLYIYMWKRNPISMRILITKNFLFLVIKYVYLNISIINEKD